MDVAEAAGEYLAAKTTLRPASHSWYTSRLAVFSQWCEEHHLQLEQVKAKVIGEFIDYVAATRTPHKADAPISTYTLAGYVCVIKAFLHFCLEDEEYSEFVKPIVVKRIKLPRITQTIIDIFTDEQVEALIKACKQNYNDHLRARDECIVMVLLSTGVRSDELCTLTIAHVHLDPKDSYIKVLGKGRKEREVPLDEQPRRLLKKYLRQFRAGAKPDTTVFVDRSCAHPLGKDALQGIFERLGKWAQVSGVRCSPHTCRHYFAAHFWQEHQDIYALSRILGHASVNVTEHYLRSLSSIAVRLALQRVK